MYGLPAGLLDTGDLPRQCQTPEANAAEAELTDVTAGAPAELAAVMLLHGKFGWSL